MLQGARRNLGHRAGEAGTAPLGQHQPVGTEGFGTAHDGPQVLGIGEAIEGNQQGWLADGGAALDQAGQIEGVSGGGLQGDALVHRSAGELAQPGPGDLLHQHTRGLGLAQELQKLGAGAHLRRAPDAVDRPAALERRLGGMATPNQIGAGVDAVAFGLAGSQRRSGVNDQGPGGGAQWRPGPARTKTALDAGAGSAVIGLPVTNWSPLTKGPSFSKGLPVAKGPPVS